MADFKEYVERRERCEAVRYTGPDQAYWIARELFNTWDYCVTHDALNLTLGPATSMGKRQITIMRGDYIVKVPGSDLQCKVVGRSEFNRQFEPLDG